MINEYTLGFEIFSLHGGNAEQVNIDNSVIISYPRAYTPVCTEEMEMFNKRRDEFADAGIQLYLASADSPEVNNIFASTFDDDILLPILTMKSDTSGAQFQRLFNNGYTIRATVMVKDGDPTIIPEPNDEVRDFDRVLADAKAYFDV